MSVLALDLGTSCGWAVDHDKQLSSGAWQLKPTKLSPDLTRELTFWRRLQDVIAEHGKPELVAYEEVVAHGRSGEKEVQCTKCKAKQTIRIQETNVIAAQVYGALRGVLLMWCDSHKIKVEGVAVGTLKKFATQSGRATKEDMVAWAKLRWRDQNISTHDQADALHVLDWALVEVLGRREKQLVDVRKTQPTEVEF